MDKNQKMRNAECGMRNERKCRQDAGVTFYRIPHSAYRIFFLLLFPFLSFAAPAASVRLSAVDEAGKWGASMHAAAERALPRAEKRLGLKLDGTVEILSLPDEFAFESYLGGHMVHIVAVARPARCQIVINRPAWFRETPAQQEQTLVHEMTHLLLGRRIKERLPAWLDEGLAMLTAEEGDFETTWRVMINGTFDTLLPVPLLMDRVAIGEGRQELAYAQSLSLTQFYIRQQFPEGKGLDPAPLVARLADPALGARRVKLLWDPVLVSSLEYHWRQSYNTVWSLILVLSGSSLLWAAITLLFLLAWWRKRRMARGIRERFEREEHWDAEFRGELPLSELGPVDEIGEGSDEEEEWRR